MAVPVYAARCYLSDASLAPGSSKPASASSQSSVLPSSVRMAPPAAASSQIVTIPVIPELYDPNFLDVLLPKRDVPLSMEVRPAEATHPMIDALKTTTNRTRTTNNDPAYSSTLSSTLDAFQAFKPHCADSKLNDILPKAWDEDPALTLRIIWNSRSIHDGKSDRESFYQ